MAARSLSNGTISFGLVTIPVKLYSTGEASAGVHFNMVHKSCGTQVKQRYWCPKDEEYVDKTDIGKGYEFAKGQFVMFNDEELKALNPEPTNAIEITEFVPLAKVDPVYFDKSYYLGPDKAGGKPYLLLATAMRDRGQAALARYRARGKDYLVLLRPFENGLVLQQLRYADEVRAFAEVPMENAELKPAELELAHRRGRRGPHLRHPGLGSAALLGPGRCRPARQRGHQHHLVRPDLRRRCAQRLDECERRQLPHVWAAGQRAAVLLGE